MDPSQQKFQLITFFHFSRSDWEEHPIVTLQLGLPFGAVQIGTYLKLGMNIVADEAKSKMAEIVIRYLSQVDNMLGSTNIICPCKSNMQPHKKSTWIRSNMCLKKHFLVTDGARYLMNYCQI